MPFKKTNREIAFMLGVGVYLIVLVIAGSGLSKESLSFPKMVIGATVVIICLKLIVSRVPALRFLDPKINVKGGQASQPQQEAEKSGETSSFNKPLAFILWLATFPAGVYTIGFLPTLAIWLFIFLLFLSRLKWPKALLVCVCTIVGIYLIFALFFKIRFSTGFLF